MNRNYIIRLKVTKGSVWGGAYRKEQLMKWNLSQSSSRSPDKANQSGSENSSQFGISCEKSSGWFLFGSTLKSPVPVCKTTVINQVLTLAVRLQGMCTTKGNPMFHVGHMLDVDFWMTLTRCSLYMLELWWLQKKKTFSRWAFSIIV